MTCPHQGHEVSVCTEFFGIRPVDPSPWFCFEQQLGRCEGINNNHIAEVWLLYIYQDLLYPVWSVQEGPVVQ